MRVPFVVLVLAAIWPGVVGAEELRFAILGDRTGSHQPGVYERTIAEIDLLAPDFVVTVGDHIEGYTEDRAVLAGEWDEYQALIAPLEGPFYICPGNHDILNDVQAEVWRERTGREENYAFDHGGVHFIILDTGRWESSAEWLAHGDHRAWLEADLATHAGAALTLAVFHKPYWYHTLADGLADPLHEIFLRGGVDAVFNGHFHLYGTARYDGIVYTMVGSSGGAIEGVPERGAFYHWVWAVVRDGTLTWAVISEDGVEAADVVRVEDQKFFDRLDADYVRLSPLMCNEEPVEAGLACRLALRNLPAGPPLRATVAWETGGNWTIEPPSLQIDVPASETREGVFRVARTGPFYPLPRVRFEYPYREGRSFTYESNLPALRRQEAARFDRAPEIDGRLEDAAWAEAGRTGHFGSPDGGACTIEPTEFFFGHDAEALYLGARCSQAGELVAQAVQRDGAVSRDDCVGYFLCPDDSARVVYQIYVNSAGIVFDQHIVWVPPDRYEGEGSDWNGEFTVRTQRAGGVWTTEARIPYAALSTAPPAPGSAWRVNFRRKDAARGSAADW
ncbi:MAG: metallophosphoesterase, partial [Candidatus Eisenbacteria bacterium]